MVILMQTVTINKLWLDHARRASLVLEERVSPYGAWLTSRWCPRGSYAMASFPLTQGGSPFRKHFLNVKKHLFIYLFTYLAYQGLEMWCLEDRWGETSNPVWGINKSNNTKAEELSCLQDAWFTRFKFKNVHSSNQIKLTFAFQICASQIIYVLSKLRRGS